LKQGHWPNEKKPTLAEIAREVSNMAIKAERADIARLIDEAYSNEVLEQCSSRMSPLVEQAQEAFHRCRIFLWSLLTVYFEQRLSYRNSPAPRLYKNPFWFGVFELLINDDYGLYGFRMHFSNGGSAWFERHPDTHDGLNIMFKPHIEFFVG